MKFRKPVLLYVACALAVFCGWRVSPARSQAPKPAAKDAVAAPPATPTVPAKAAELTAADLESFLDGLMPEQIQHDDIAGAVVAVVKDGKLLFAKGYGYSDIEKRKPVDPDVTLFRPGSISKLFTWTSVMQQVEQGKLDLDKDVNAYLDFKVPATFGKPTTLRDIMTHRPGLQETIKDLFVASAADLRPMNQYLPAHLPAQIFPPGTIPAYSNYATTMAAYIVQRVSGQPFDDYVEEHIFKPLNMTHATFRQPLPDSLKADMSQGYVRASQPAKPFEYVEVAPAGSLSASAESMSHFMIAHLQNGRYGDAQILKPETAVEMHSRQKGWPDSMPAMALGFYEETRNGHRIIGHGGDTVCFHSDLHLILDSNVGFFVSYNSAGHAEDSPRTDLFEKFLDRYFPYTAAAAPVLSTAAQDAKQVQGLYKVSRRFETNILGITTLLGETKIVADPKDNTIFVPEAFKLPNGQPKHFQEIAPMLFQEVHGQDKIAFVKDSNGQTLAYIDYPFMLFQKIESPFQKNVFNYIIIGFSVAVIVLTILLWPVAAILRRHYAKPLSLDPRAKRLRMVIRLVCFLDIAFMAGLLIALQGLEKPGGLGQSGDFWIHLLQIAGVLTGFGALIAVLNAFISWSDKQQWLWYRIWNICLAVGCVGFFWFITYWHMLNFNLNY